MSRATSLPIVVCGTWLACGCSADTEPDVRTRVAEVALDSPAYSLACEAASSFQVALYGGSGLAAWLNSAVHATRLDADGAPVDQPPIDLGSPPPPLPGNPWIVGSVRVAQFVGNSFVVTVTAHTDPTFQDPITRTSAWYRVVAADGSLGPWIAIVQQAFAPYCCATQTGIYGVVFDGAHVLAAVTSGFQYGVDPGKIDYPLKIYQLDGVAATNVYEVPSLKPLSGGPLDPAFFGLGCHDTACLLLFARPPATELGVYSYESMIIGTPSQIIGSFVGSGKVVGTPLGFLHLRPGSTKVTVTSFTPAGAIAVPPVDAWTGLAPISSFQAAPEPDFGRTRVVWTSGSANNWSLLSGLLADNGTSLAAPSIEDPALAASYSAVSQAYFGGGAALVAYVRPSGLSARFVGSALPPTLPPDQCTCSGVVCAALDQCHLVGTCDPTTATCSNPAKPDGSACSDGDACTQTDACLSGVCVAGGPLTCNDGNPCTIDGCDPASGCTAAPVPNGTSCSDADACNGAETCQAGRCAPGNPLVCDDGDPCTIEGCDSIRGCTSIPMGGCGGSGGAGGGGAGGGGSEAAGGAGASGGMGVGGGPGGGGMGVGGEAGGGGMGVGGEPGGGGMDVGEQGGGSTATGEASGGLAGSTSSEATGPNGGGSSGGCGCRTMPQEGRHDMAVLGLGLALLLARRRRVSARVELTHRSSFARLEAARHLHRRLHLAAVRASPLTRARRCFAATPSRLPPPPPAASSQVAGSGRRATSGASSE